VVFLKGFYVSDVMANVYPEIYIYIYTFVGGKNEEEKSLPRVPMRLKRQVCQ
jgi:hypothetical protein